jgi:hypothetical protein
MSFLDKARKKLGDLTGQDDGDKPVDQEAKSTIEQVKGEQSILDKIQNFLTGGYGTKEDLRELDKKLRDGYYSEFKTMRHRWEEINLEALKARQLNKDEYKKIIQVMDRLSEKINRADYGYAGLMDRKGSIKEDSLAKVFNYDRAVGAQINDLKKHTEETYSLIESEKWSEVSPRIRMAKLMLLDLEEKWDSREKIFRPMEVQ